MSWRLRIEHATGYRYAGPVVSSYNEARLIPLTDARQLTHEATVVTDPPANAHRYWDYWGTLVTAFDLHVPHEELSVTGQSVVETADEVPPPPDPPGWADLCHPPVRDRFVELLRPTAYTPAHPELAEVARSLAGRHPPASFLPTVGEWVRERLAYQPGTTGAHTSAADAWQVGEGVCQDFAHLTLVLLRAAGVPARYVSGYLHPRRGAEVGESVVGQSHAWVEGWLGEWWGFDPTNGGPVGERHVVVARGRDYADVPPLHGIYSGGPPTSLGVSVAVTRLR